MNHLKVQLLCRAYQARGHKANIDPLGIRDSSTVFGNVKPRELTLKHYNFSERTSTPSLSSAPSQLYINQQHKT